MALKEKYRAIEDGTLPDDYTNHFYLHFGFYDENTIRYSGAGKYLENNYDITTGTTFNQPT